MCKFKGILSGITVICLLVVPLFYYSVKASDIACEFYSEDILKDIPTGSVVTESAKLDIKAKSVVLMEPHTGEVLYANNESESLAPASITKIMSLLLVMEALENEKITLQTVVSTSEYAASMGGSQIWLEVGETMTVDELLRASVIASANDATVALAEAVAGSEETFVELMNERAATLGMKNTKFVNSCGLDAEEHLTTAYDVALMASALIKHDLIKKYSTVWMDALRDGKSELVNTNKLVRYYDGATGLKTGTTSKAGCCVAATAKRGDMELVAVVMGGENSNERFSGAKKMLDYGFANWSFTKLEADISDLDKIPVKKGMQDSITPEAEGNISLLLKKGKEKDVKQIVTVAEQLNAPVKKGDVIGSVKMVIDSKTVGEIPITSANDVEEVTFFSMLNLLLKSTLG